CWRPEWPRRRRASPVGVCGEFGLHYRAVFLAEWPLDALKGDRIDVPGIAGDVDHLLDPAVMRCMEAVVHAGRQAQRDIAAVAVRLDQCAIAEQILQRVGKTLGLIELSAGDRAASADDGVAGTDQNIRPAVDRPRPVLELAGEAVVH